MSETRSASSLKRMAGNIAAGMIRPYERSMTTDPEDFETELDRIADVTARLALKIDARVDALMRQRNGVGFLTKVVEALKAREAESSVEYPGFIRVPIDDVHEMNVGNINGFWSADIVTKDGHAERTLVLNVGADPTVVELSDEIIQTLDHLFKEEG